VPWYESAENSQVEQGNAGTYEAPAGSGYYPNVSQAGR